MTGDRSAVAVAGLARLLEGRRTVALTGAGVSTESGIPVAIVNLGETRGDDDAAVRVRGRTGTILPALAASLIPRRALRPRHR